MNCNQCRLVQYVTVFPYRCACGRVHQSPKSEPVEPTTPEQLAAWPFVWTYYAAGAVGEELRYSIRSVLKHHPRARVIVVGDRPDWYAGEHIHCPRIGKTEFHAFRDCYNKLQTAARELPQYIWMMDDIYWLRPFAITEASQPKFVREVTPERLRGWTPKNAWQRTRARAYEWLIENGHPLRDFAAHLPQPIVAESFQAMERDLRLATGQYRNWECVYFNAYHRADAANWGTRYLRVTQKVDAISTTHKILNHTDSKYRGAVERFLAAAFARRSPVERRPIRGVGTLLRELVGCGCKDLPWRAWDRRGVQWCTRHQRQIARTLARNPKTGLTVEQAAERVLAAIEIHQRDCAAWQNPKAETL